MTDDKSRMPAGTDRLGGDTSRPDDWNRTEWEGEGQDGTSTDATDATGTADAAVGDRWNKNQWVGDQGQGAPLPQDPDSMPEGENALSGDRHAPGEEHWARGQASSDTE